MAGFNKDMSASAYREATAGSMVEQLNLVVSTIHLKRVESRSTNMETLLKRYRGSDATTNQRYANQILSCKACLDSNGVTESCLNRVR